MVSIFIIIPHLSSSIDLENLFARTKTSYHSALLISWEFCKKTILETLSPKRCLHECRFFYGLFLEQNLPIVISYREIYRKMLGENQRLSQSIILFNSHLLVNFMKYLGEPVVRPVIHSPFIWTSSRILVEFRMPTF